MELGFWYESSAVVPDATQPPEVDDEVIDYVPSGRPGHRAPHVWLEREGGRISTLDLFGRGLTLLACPRGQWTEKAAEAGRNFGIEIQAHTIGPEGDLVDVDGNWAQQYGVTEGGAVLVRPDGHVAWRACDATAAQTLKSVLGRILARNGETGDQ
jgi:hypothetical protein